MSIIGSFIFPIEKTRAGSAGSECDPAAPVPVVPAPDKKPEAADDNAAAGDPAVLPLTAPLADGSDTDMPKTDPDLSVQTAAAVTIASILSSRGLSITECDRAYSDMPEVICGLSKTIALNYTLCSAFIKYLKESICKRAFSFVFYMSQLTAEERKATAALAALFENYGIISELYVAHDNAKINGTIANLPKVISYLNGSFLEIFALDTVRKIVSEKAAELNLDYEVISNVHVTDGTVNHELDFVFRIGKDLFLGEAKSGRFTPQKYYEVGNWVGVIPDRCILLTAGKSGDACEAISYFYDYFAANVSMFETSLRDMISRTIKEGI